MNHFLRGVARAVFETFDLQGPILEVGSYQVDGQESIINLRSFFQGEDYTGLDIRPGPGVDCVASVEQLPFVSSHFGTVIAFNAFEHVRCFWKGFEEIGRVLRPDGALFLSCPFYFREHNYPADYWRFTPKAIEYLLRDYPSKVIGWHGAEGRPQNVWALAFGHGRREISLSQVERYRSLVQRWAIEPERSWSRRWRYQLARLLVGRGPFASYLDRNRWESICLNHEPDELSNRSQWLDHPPGLGLDNPASPSYRLSEASLP